MTNTKPLAIVTGASRGIGKAIAHRLATDGFYVVGTATSDSGAEGISKTLGDRGRGVVLQLTDTNGTKATIEALIEEFEALPVLVNNAGITRDNLAIRMKPEQWDEVIQTNLTAQMHLCQLALKPMMKARYGRIINITSIVAFSGNPGQTNYSAAKAGMVGFSKSLALEVATRGITVNCVAPGFIQTDMSGMISEKQKEFLIGQIPSKALGEPVDIAHAVAFLASKEAKYITAQTLHVNGGLWIG